MFKTINAAVLWCDTSVEQTQGPKAENAVLDLGKAILGDCYRSRYISVVHHAR